MAEKKWIAGAIKHPGSLTKAAKAANQTVAGYCNDAHLSAHRQAQCRLAHTLEGMHKK
jgi:hypothetical protein